MTGPHPIAAETQRRYRSAVLTNRLRFERRWGQPCLAYNVCIRPGPAASATLSAVQEAALDLEPSLLRVPAPALHTNLAWLLPVHQEFGRPKDELWRLHGPGWMTTLTGILGPARGFRLCYRHLVATDAAIIAVADEPNRVSALRRELLPVLPVPGDLSAGELVHMTLFRYVRPLRDPGIAGALARYHRVPDRRRGERAAGSPGEHLSVPGLPGPPPPGLARPACPS